MRVFITVLCLFALVFQVKADERKKSYEKKSSKGDLEELIINNKYGKIEVEQHDGEELEVIATMTAVAKTAAKADEVLGLVQVIEMPIGNKLQLETELGKEMNLPQFLTGFTLSIDYKVLLPRGIDLRLICSNGDVYINHFEGELNVDIQYGNFKAATLKGGEVNIKQHKGEFVVKEVVVLNGEFKECKLCIEIGEKIFLTTNACNGELGSLDELNIRSSGGTLKIGDIEELRGSSSFTKYEVQDLANLLDMDLKMGEMNIRNVQKMFSQIRMSASFTKVGLTFPQGAGYQLELKRNKSLKLELPEGVALDEHAERNKIIGTKHIGDIQFTGQVLLDISNGSLFIQ